MLVYAAKCTVTGEEYVGFTTIGLVARRKRHETNSRARPGALYDAMRQHGIGAFSWRTLEFTCDKSAEARWAARLRPALNSMRGCADGKFRHSEGSKSKVAEGVRKWNASHPEKSKAAEEKRRAAVQSESVRRRISASLGGSRVKVTKEGKLVGVYASQHESARELGVLVGNVNACLLGRRSHTHGYEFSHVE